MTISDEVSPAAAAPTGALVSEAGWLSGSHSLTMAGTDSTGIRKLQLLANGTPAVTWDPPPASAGGCKTVNSGVAYTYAAPCAGSRGLNGAQSQVIATTNLPNGTIQIRTRAHDTAGNTSDSDAVQIKVDNEAPAAPTPGTAAGWTSAADATWTWVVPTETDRAPIDGIEIELCAENSCAMETLPGQAFGSTVTVTRALQEGASSIRARHIDSAGNTGAWSAKSTALRDRTAPTMTIDTPGSPVQPGAQVDPVVTAQDGLSGVSWTTKEFRVNGGAWQAMTGPVEAPAGAVLRFRAAASDHAGNVRADVESGDVIVATPTVQPEATVTPGETTTGSGGPTTTSPLTAKPTLTKLKANRRSSRLRVTGRASGSTALSRVKIFVAYRDSRNRRRRKTYSVPVIGDTFRANLKVKRLASHRIVVTYGDARRVVRVKRAAR